MPAGERRTTDAHESEVGEISFLEYKHVVEGEYLSVGVRETVEWEP